MKTLILSNSCKWKTWNAKIEALRAWFEPALKLDIKLEHTDYSNIQWEKGTDNEGKSYMQVKKTWLEKIIPNGYDVVIFTINKSDWEGFPADGYRTTIGNKQVVVIGSKETGRYDFQGKRYPGDKWWNIARHELCHAIYKLQGKYDMTHTYWKQGNIEQVLVDLKQPTTPVVTLTRDTYDLKQTLGSLNIGNFRCKTLERPWKNNERNVSCIPEGEYKVKWTFSPKFMKYTYEVLGVPNRSAIRIHKGNYWYDIQGCILLGTEYSDVNKDGTMDIINSTKTVKDFDTLMGGKDFILRII